MSVAAQLREHAVWVSAVGGAVGIVCGWLSWLVARGWAAGHMRAQIDSRLASALSAAQGAQADAGRALSAIDALRLTLGEHMAGTATVEARLGELEHGHQALRERLARLGADVGWLREVGQTLLSSAPHLPGAAAALAAANAAARKMMTDASGAAGGDD